MPVSGLVITLDPPPQNTPDYPDSPDTSEKLRHHHAHVIAQINQHPNLQAGPLQGQRLPVVVDTPDREADKLCWQWLNDLQGVHHVDVAFIHFEDEDAFGHAPCQTHTRNQADQLIPSPTIGET